MGFVALLGIMTYFGQFEFLFSDSYHDSRSTDLFRFVDVTV